MLTKEKLAVRNESIGSSEAAAILGLSRWDTPLSVWGRKTGELPADDRPSLPKEVGNELEDLVCTLFTRRSGFKVRRVNETVIHPDYPFITANIDRRLEKTDDILEAKTASGWKAKEWAGEEIPSEYIIQCMHQLAVTGKRRCWIAVLIGGNQDFIYKCLPRDEGMIQNIINEEVRFWNDFVLKRVMPLATSIDSKNLNVLFPSADEGQEVSLGNDVNPLIDERNSLILAKKECETRCEEIENVIKQRIGTASRGVTDKYYVAWKNVIRAAHQVKESRFRKLDIKKLDKEI